MTESQEKTKFLDAQQVIFLPKWARFSILFLLGFLALAACFCAVIFLFHPELRDKVLPVMSIAQTAAGGFAVVLFVLFAEKQLSTSRLHEKTSQFLDVHVIDALSRIELPQVKKNKTAQVSQLVRAEGIHGNRKDIYGSNYKIQLADFSMKIWIGINVKRLSVIYFVRTSDVLFAESLKDIFKFTFSGAEKVGYQTNFENAIIDGEQFVSIWSTVLAENAILGNPAEQLFWVQDLAMMTQSFARTAVRHGLDVNPVVEPGPL